MNASMTWKGKRKLNSNDSLEGTLPYVRCSLAFGIGTVDVCDDNMGYFGVGPIELGIHCN